LKFQGEVWAGRACAAANEEELTTCAKFWGQEVGGRGNTKKGTRTRAVSDHWSEAADRWSPLARRPLDGRPPLGQLAAEVFFKFFFGFLLNYFFKALACSKGLDFLGGLAVQHPIFLSMLPTLGSANSSKIHGEWRFHFFSKKIIPKFSSYLNLHIYCWDFCFMKNLIP
jgi:hypothetical protein